MDSELFTHTSIETKCEWEGIHREACTLPVDAWVLVASGDVEGFCSRHASQELGMIDVRRAMEQHIQELDRLPVPVVRRTIDSITIKSVDDDWNGEGRLIRLSDSPLSLKATLRHPLFAQRNNGVMFQAGRKLRGWQGFGGDSGNEVAVYFYREVDQPWRLVIESGSGDVMLSYYLSTHQEQSLEDGNTVTIKDAIWIERPESKGR